MSEQVPGVKGNNTGGNNKEIPVTPEQREYFNIVKPLYAEKGRLEAQLRNLPRSPENTDKAREIREGIRYAEGQTSEARDSFLEGRISSFGQPGFRPTPAEAALNATSKSESEALLAQTPAKNEPGDEELKSLDQAAATSEQAAEQKPEEPTVKKGVAVSPEQKAIDEDRRKIEARLEELGGAQYQSADVKAETEKLKAQLAELDSGKLTVERQNEVKIAAEKAEIEKRDNRRREVESELEEIRKAAIVTPQLKEKQIGLEEELKSLDQAAATSEQAAEQKPEESAASAEYENIVEEARNKQAAAYSAYRTSKRAKKSGEELEGLLRAAEEARRSHYETVAKRVSALIEAKGKELEGDPDKDNKLKDYRAELFNEHFIKEYERSQALNIENFPPKEKSAVQKAVNWWMKQPRWKRLAISTGVSLALGVGTGAIATVPAVLVFGGAAVMRRWISGGASIGARATAELGLKTWDKVFGGEKKGLAYQERSMRGKFTGASLDEFIKMQQEYGEMRTIAEQREKRRRIGMLAAQVGAGVATSFILGHHADAVAKALHMSGSGIAPISHGSAEHAGGAAGTAGAGGAAAETFTPSEYIQPMNGESVWNKVSDVLQSTKQFDALQASGLHGNALEAAKTYYIDAIKDKVMADPSKYMVDGKLDLSNLFATQSGQEWLHATAAHAERLSAADVQSITHNNEVLNQFATKFSGQPLPSVQEAQEKLSGVASAAHSAAGGAGGSGVSAPAEAFVVPADNFSRATGEAFLSRLKDETLTPSQITSVLYDRERIEQLAQVTGTPFNQLYENLRSGLDYSQHTAEWLAKLNDETLRPADITTALGNKEWIDRLAQIKGVAPDDMQKTLNEALDKVQNVQLWIHNLDAGQLKSAQIETSLSDQSWVDRLAALNNVTPDKMHAILEQALNTANVKELFQGIASGKVGSAAIKAAMGNSSWVNEAAKINNTTPVNIQEILQAALTKATQAGK